MNKISVLEFFRSAELGGVKPGMTRAEARDILGEPDFQGGFTLDSASPDHVKAIWVYAGIELYWPESIDTAPLHQITFYPQALDLNRKNIDLWIFNNEESVSCTELKAALDNEAINYQDTGLEVLKFTGLGSGFKIIPKNLVAEIDRETDEILGTLVLRSGIQVRYSGDDAIIKVASGNVWSFKGSEQFIKWD